MLTGGAPGYYALQPQEPVEVHQVEDPPFRKLAVLLHADVVSSTELVRANEALAHQRIHAVFQALSKTISAHNGITHEIRGDALVAEFQMASDAVAAAIEFQASNATSNQNSADEILPVLRVGIAMGEVVVADNTVTGEGVVLAQRLEQFAEPGSVCLQGAAYETIPKRLPFAYDDLGELKLKGFDDCIRAFVVKQSMAAEVSNPVTRTLAEEVVLDLPESPSIAVLPFVNMSGDPEQEFFSDGITEDIITALSRISGLLVIARNSTMTYKGSAVDVRRVGLEQGVRYVLEGSVRKAKNRIRVTAQLIDATSGHHKWAERYDREIDDVFAVQDDITHQIMVAMRVEISVGEKAQMLAGRTKNLAAWELLIRADDLNNSIVQADNLSARHLLDKAVQIDPSCVSAWTELGWVHWEDVYFGWTSSPEQSRKLAIEAAEKALTLEPGYPNAYSLLGLIALLTEEYERAIQLCEQGVTLAPNNAENVAELAFALIQAGRTDEAQQMIRRAMRLSPICPAWYLAIAGLCHLVRKELEVAISTLRNAVDVGPDSVLQRVYLVSALVQSNHAKDAQQMAREVLGLQRGFLISCWHGVRFQDPLFRAEIIANLKQAGLP